jgi:hypothetical protein
MRTISSSEGVLLAKWLSIWINAPWQYPCMAKANLF